MRLNLSGIIRVEGTAHNVGVEAEIFSAPNGDTTPGDFSFPGVGGRDFLFTAVIGNVAGTHPLDPVLVAFDFPKQNYAPFANSLETRESVVRGEAKFEHQDAANRNEFLLTLKRA